MSLVKSLHEVELPPLSASNYGKLLIMKKSTAFASLVMLPEICHPYASSEIETGMLRPALVKADFICKTYLARLSADPASLS